MFDMRTITALGLVAAASAFQPALPTGQLKLRASSAATTTMQANGMQKAAAAAAVALPLLAGVQQVEAITSQDVRGLNYLQVKGTGLANRCPEVGEDAGRVTLQEGKQYKIVEFCLEPKSWQIEEEVGKQGKRGQTTKEFVDTKLMTRATYTLSGIDGTLEKTPDGLLFTEKGGIDYAPSTVQLPGGERVPFLFNVKELKAYFNTKDIGAGTEMGGLFRTPSYRTGLFLDPKGRGGTTGYDMAVALPGMEADGGEGQGDLFAETNKVFQVTDGSIEMAVDKADAETGEFSGVFVSEQLSDTDMGSKQPKKVLLKGIVFGRVAEYDGTEDY